MNRDPLQEFILSPSAVLRIDSVEGLRACPVYRRDKFWIGTKRRCLREPVSSRVDQIPFVALQGCVRRESRRRNCLTETTRSRLRRATLIKSRSRLRSSSLVTRYCALPRIAASRISSSSGSRHIFSSPEISTTVARAASNRTYTSASRWGYRNRRTNLGLLRTSRISASWEREVITLNSSRPQAATTCPGGPAGFKKAETQTLVSSRTTSGTAFCLNLGPCPSYFRLNDVLWNRFGTSFHSLQHAFKFIPPLPLWVEGNQDAGLLLQSQRSQGSENAVLVHRSKRFFGWMNAFWQRHVSDYTGASRLRQADSAPFFAEADKVIR